ncbi:Schwann cell myelin protein-like isoform X1 [Ranitomeya variabilis]|uniref:Schwann cell myelin protein-like isoform X1 n=1 Tax=Ranitomeya variabilis TaxID=490064 RepID=UPI0040573ED5
MREKCAFLVSMILQVCMGEENKFIFPRNIQGLLGSCVEIPCYKRTSPAEAQTNKVVWYVQGARRGERIIYSTDVSQISSSYKNRAELVRRTTLNCTLRIHNVNRQDERSYFPQEDKVLFYRGSTQYVQLEVTAQPPEPIFFVPNEMVVGENTAISCTANYTCASSPPTITWNLLGPYATEMSDLGDGKWSVTSKVVYKPSEAENGSKIQCTVTYFGGQIIKTVQKINIKADQKTNHFIGPVIGVICIILVLAVVFIIWRKRDSCFWRKKTESNSMFDPMQSTLSKNSTRYTDLIQRQTTSYYTLEPTAHCPLPKKGQNGIQSCENEHVYEDMSIKRTK